MNASVSAQISADNSVFLRGVNAAKEAAKTLQSTLTSLKAPPLPDIAKQLGLQKAQVFKDPFGPEWKAGLQRGTAALKAELDKQAALYRENNRLALPSIQRVALSGAPSRPDMSHLDGTQFEGGTRGQPTGTGRRGFNASGLAIGYNAIQDLVQSGPMAIANNVPQIIELVAKSPALKILGAASFAAAGAFFAYDQISKAYQKHGDGPMQQKMFQASLEIRARERDYAREQSMIEAGLAGAGEGTAAVKQSEERAKQLQQEDDIIRRRKEIAALEEDANVAAILAQKDRIKAERDYADLKINNLTAAREMEAERARKEYEDAERARLELDTQFQRTKNRIEEITEGNRRAGTAMTEKETLELARLQASLPGISTAAGNANTRAELARTGLADANSGLNEKLPIEQRIINQRADSNISRMQEQNGTNALNTFFRSAVSGMRELAELGQLYERSTRQSKEQAAVRDQMTQQLELSELQSGSPRRAAKKQRELDQAAAVDKYKQAGFSESDAKDMAAREQKVADRRANPRRIRGAGSSPARDRESALDYFDGKKMSGPQTSTLDEYAERRSVPGVGKTVDHDLAEKDAAAAKKATAASAPEKTGDTTTHTLLKQLLSAFQSFSGTAAPSTSPAPSAASTS